MRRCFVALVDHAVTLVVVHHDGRVDLHLLCFSPVELHVPLLPPRQHERLISIWAKAHIVVVHVVEDSVVLSSHRRGERLAPHPFYRVREGVLHSIVSRNTPVDMGELAAGSLVCGIKLLGAPEYGVGPF
jgi:hypothetical protein